MTMHRIALAAAALLLGATPIAQAGSRHVDISVNLGYPLPVQLDYVERPAPVVIYRPVPVIHYRPVYGHPAQYYYRDHHRYDRHGKWQHRVHHQQYRDQDRGHDRDYGRDRHRGRD